jgi:tetratricopeptide (TPR) repeat protein
MPRRSATPIPRLPRLNETWFVAIQRLRVWIEPPHEKPQRPILVLVLNADIGTIRGSQMFPTTPTPAQVRDTLFQVMRRPVPYGGEPGVPRQVFVEERALADALAELLRKESLDIAVATRPQPPEVSESIHEFEEQANPNDDPPGILSVADATPELGGEFFAAAAEFYRAAPWIKLSNAQVLAFKLPTDADDRYVIVMGQGGVEYGLAMYSRWEDVVRMFTASDDPREAFPESGAHSLMFNPITQMPFDDLDAIEQYGWEIAGDDAYPFPVIFNPPEVKRPPRVELRAYVILLRVIPLLMRDHLKSDGHGDYRAFEARVSVPTMDGAVEIVAKYPAGEILFAEQPVTDVRMNNLDDPVEAVEAMPFFDRRSMEGIMRDKLRELGAPDETHDAKLAQAQELMFRAFESDNPAKRIALAHDALALSENCADAYVLLAEEEADTVSRALELYQQGVAAGERALGDQFEDYVGDFWSVLETRPYMRARHGLAMMLWRLNRLDETIGHFREMLRLNPNDNQGVRDALLDIYLLTERYADAPALIQQYQDDWTATWLYSRALLTFREQGASAQANKYLADAREENPFVPEYVTGRKRVPNQLPDVVGWGDESEAITYAANHLNYWRVIPGAVAWAAEQAQARPKPARRKTSRRVPGGRRIK